MFQYSSNCPYMILWGRRRIWDPEVFTDREAIVSRKEKEDERMCPGNPALLRCCHRHHLFEFLQQPCWEVIIISILPRKKMGKEDLWSVTKVIGPLSGRTGTEPGPGPKTFRRDPYLQRWGCPFSAGNPFGPIGKTGHTGILQELFLVGHVRAFKEHCYKSAILRV